MALARLGGHGLSDEAAQGVEVDDVEDLGAEPGGTGSEEHGILERGAERADRAH
jgi:hypothetical protein